PSIDTSRRCRPLRYLVAVLLLRPPARSPLCPYTTLFRSAPARCASSETGAATDFLSCALLGALTGSARAGLGRAYGDGLRGRVRSEEHTSELQSRENLVCRLLLENKNLDTMANGFQLAGV